MGVNFWWNVVEERKMPGNVKALFLNFRLRSSALGARTRSYSWWWPCDFLTWLRNLKHLGIRILKINPKYKSYLWSVPQNLWARCANLLRRSSSNVIYVISSCTHKESLLICWGFCQTMSENDYTSYYLLFTEHKVRVTWGCLWVAVRSTNGYNISVWLF